MQWLVGGASYVGAGLRSGDSLSVGWAMPGKDGAVVRGVTTYRIEAKKLTGRWVSLPGGGQPASETLTWLKDVEDDE